MPRAADGIRRDPYDRRLGTHKAGFREKTKQAPNQNLRRSFAPLVLAETGKTKSRRAAPPRQIASPVRHPAADTSIFSSNAYQSVRSPPCLALPRDDGVRDAWTWPVEAVENSILRAVPTVGWSCTVLSKRRLAIGRRGTSPVELAQPRSLRRTDESATTGAAVPSRCRSTTESHRASAAQVPACPARAIERMKGIPVCCHGRLNADERRSTGFQVG